jgi:hypothetical protein
VHDGAPPAACVLVLADVIASTSNADTARAWLARVRRAPIVPLDPIVAPLAVELAARGVVAPEDLALDQRIELAARAWDPGAVLALDHATLGTLEALAPPLEGDGLRHDHTAPPTLGEGGEELAARWLGDPEPTG